MPGHASDDPENGDNRDQSPGDESSHAAKAMGRAASFGPAGHALGELTDTNQAHGTRSSTGLHTAAAGAANRGQAARAARRCRRLRRRSCGVVTESACHGPAPLSAWRSAVRSTRP